MGGWEGVNNCRDMDQVTRPSNLYAIRLYGGEHLNCSTGADSALKIPIASSMFLNDQYHACIGDFGRTTTPIRQPPTPDELQRPPASAHCHFVWPYVREWLGYVAFPPKTYPLLEDLEIGRCDPMHLVWHLGNAPPPDSGLRLNF